ncbi:acyl-CoA thioesterase [Niabella insulamsoli]|uniref:acyl-CoA thioesterase n=1 Tax=Niabella insulamsoli TaxID=3144874 RepID=UPI0031FBEE7E
MATYAKEVEVRWSDLDANAHLRHSVYYDWGAFCRIEFLREHGLSTSKMQELHIGPVLFREECIFRKEIRQGDRVAINMELTRARKDFSRFSMRHTITKNDTVMAAVLQLDGAWMDTVLRKLAAPPALVVTSYDQMPKSADFEWLNID